MEIRNSSFNLRELFNMKKKDSNLNEEYKKAKKAHFNLINETKKSFYQNNIMSSKNFSKSAWKIINTISNKKSTNEKKNIKIKVDNIPEENPQKIVDLFN